MKRGPPCLWNIDLTAINKGRAGSSISPSSISLHPMACQVGGIIRVMGSIFTR